MRCSILAVGDFPEGGATSQRLFLLAKLLNEGVGETALWILQPTTKHQLQDNTSITGVWGGVSFRYLSGSTVRPSTVSGALIDTLKGIVASLRLLIRRETRPDILVVYTPVFLKYIVPMLVASYLRIPLIVESCEIPSESVDRLNLGLIRRWANSGEILMEHLIPKLAVGMLAISGGIRRYYETMGLAKHDVYLLPVLIDYDRYAGSEGSPIAALQGQRFLLNSGSFSEKDGLSFLVAAVAMLRVQHPDIKLVFTGGATQSVREKLTGMAGSEGADWLLFTGFLSRDELIWCYKNAVGLLSCRSNSSYANFGFPTKLAEYLASGSPVIATRVGDVEEYLSDGENALLAEPENVESIASALGKLLADPLRAKHIGRKGADVARQFFDYRNHVVQVAQFIQRKTEGSRNV
ncbi:MAG: glycosyltransferase [Methylococcaceae bacterium]|nr:glycosyltransferase [Methylococcaceae bacterium]